MRRIYLRRRVVVAIVALAAAVSVIALAKALVGGDSTQTKVASAASTDDSTALRVPASAEVTTTTATPPSLPSETTVVDAGPTPTPADPARVYIAGDSDAGSFAPFVSRLLRASGVVATTVDYKVSSGLARPDFFDWPARLSVRIPKLNPDIVIVAFGGNDAQPIHGLNKQVDTAEWRAEYAKRVGAVMDLVANDGRTLIWVGVPNDNQSDTTARLKVQDEVVRAQVAAHPGVVFIDSWNIFSGLDGGYAQYVVDPRDGVSKSVRSDVDGFHLNTTGAEILAFHIARAVESDLVSRGADLASVSSDTG
jgi:hypothetical protein